MRRWILVSVACFVAAALLVGLTLLLLPPGPHEVESRLNRGLADGHEDFVLKYGDHDVIVVDHDAGLARFKAGFRTAAMVDFRHGRVYEDENGWHVMQTDIQGLGQYLGGFDVQGRENGAYRGQVAGRSFGLGLDGDRFSTISIGGKGLHFEYRDVELKAPAVHGKLPLRMSHVPPESQVVGQEHVVEIQGLQGSPHVERLRLRVIGDGVEGEGAWKEKVGGAIDFRWDDGDGDGRLDNGETYSFKLLPGVTSLVVVDAWAEAPVRPPVTPWAPEGHGAPAPFLPVLAMVVLLAWAARRMEK